MREIAVRIWDDLDWAERQEKKEAAGSVLIGLDGSWRELDLSAVHLDEVRALLTRYLAAGHKPEDNGTAIQAPSGTQPHKRRIPRESLTYGAAIRAFADKQDPPRNYRTKGGSYYYGTALREEFAQYLEQTEPGSPTALFARANILPAGNQIQKTRKPEPGPEDS